MALAPRYARTVETMAIVRALLNGEAIDHAGEHYQIKIDPPRLATVTGRCPPFCFGGLSPDAREAAAIGAEFILRGPTPRARSWTSSSTCAPAPQRTAAASNSVTARMSSCAKRRRKPH